MKQDVARLVQLPLECHLHVLSRLPTESIPSPFLKVTQNEGPALKKGPFLLKCAYSNFGEVIGTRLPM